MNNKIKVMYIMGTGRSGSTILEILFAHGEHCLGVGELTSIVQDGFIENKPCSCGKPFYQCLFWGKVANNLGLSQDEISEWASLQHKIEWHSGFFRQLMRIIPSHDWQRYCNYNLRLFQVLREVSGMDVIVDSSKYIGRALALATMPEVDLDVICLTRSPEGLMASFQKPNKDEQQPKKPWAVLCYYTLVMFSLRMALKRLGNRVVSLLQYEDLISDPIKAISAIAKKSDIDIETLIDRLRQDKKFEVGHLVTGNRLRKNKNVRFMRKQHVPLPRKIKFLLTLKIMNCLKLKESYKNRT